MNLLDYSGVVLNQNAQTTDTFTWDGNWVYQTFTLPINYTRGAGTPGAHIPDLTGIQVYVTVDNGQAVNASLNYVVQYYAGDNDGWVPLTEGSVTGVQNSGEVWVNLMFPQSVPIPAALLSGQFRFGLQGVAHIPSFQYVRPTPLIRVATTGQGQLYGSDGFTPLVSPGSASMNFRILAMTADSGVNFLGNQYRSAVVLSAPGNVTTTDGQVPVQGSGQGSYWLSPPQPSRFAVQSLYFDLRPVRSTPQITALNAIGNPSFEYDSLNQAPQWWSAFSNGGTVVNQSVKDLWAYDRGQSLHMKYTFSGANQQQGVVSPLQTIAPTIGGIPTPFAISAQYNLFSFTNAELVLTVLFYDNTQTLLPAPYGSSSFTFSPTVGTGGWHGTVSAPANANYVQYMVTALSTGAGAIEAYVDAIQVTLTDTVQPYFDGDDVNCEWTDQRGQSASVKLTTLTQDNQSIVVDGVLVDPLTPNMALNVYYTEDDAHTNDQMTEDDWEQKLWTRVPKVFTCTQRQQYVFPKPVVAKYMKVEFTNLQAQSYDPGPFSKPVKYKKFPTWVAQYFLAQIEFASFVVSRIDVQLDALTFAYDYYLDDLHQAPETPTPPTTDAIGQLSSYFASGNAATNIDHTTLSKINLAMQPFQLPGTAHIDGTTALGSFISSIYGSIGVTASSTVIQPTLIEGGSIPTPDYSVVSSINRDSLVFEQSMPVMYFFVACRHGYKELSAPFQYNRAYFAGVKEVSFIRNDYTVTSDTNMYNELGQDTTNTEINEWTVDSDGTWHTY